MFITAIQTLAWIVVGLFALGTSMSFIIVLAMLAISQRPVPQPEPGEILPEKISPTPSPNGKLEIQTLCRHLHEPTFNRSVSEAGAHHA